MSPHKDAQIPFRLLVWNNAFRPKCRTKSSDYAGKRSKINDEDDYRIEKCRDELIDALSQDELLTIDILNQLNEKEILYTSEVFEEIAYNLQSVNYINCLKYIEKKYPSLDIKDAIEVATEFI